MHIRRILLASAVSVAALQVAAAHAECGDVTITEMSWASSQVVSTVATFLMETGYGCTVTAFPSDPNPAVTSVAETGQPEILTEMWENSSGPAVWRGVDEGKLDVVANVLSDGGQEGWWIPRYLLDAHPELATLEGVVAHPDWVGGLFNNCPDGWTCKNTNTNLLRAVGLTEDKMRNFTHGSSDTLSASLAAAYEAKEPWIGYYWAPTALLGRYDMVRVDLGEYDPEIYACLNTEDCADPGVSAYPDARVMTVLSTAFKEANPEIGELMSNISFTNAQMGEILAWQDDNSATTEEAAVYFLTTYPDVWSVWISEGAREKLAAVLQ